MSYYGDIALGDTIDIKFTTVDSTGAPVTLAGTPVVSAYVGNSVTELTAGITLTVDFDARTGLHNVRVVASSGNGYASGTDVELVITTGTAGGTSMVGYRIGGFSIEKRSGLRPTTAGRTLDVASTGEAGLDFSNVLIPAGSVPIVGFIDNGTMQAGSAAGTAVLRAAASFVTDLIQGATLVVHSGTGAGQSRVIHAWNNTTKTASVSPNWVTTPDATSVYVVVPTPPSPTNSTTLPSVNMTAISGTAVNSSSAQLGVNLVNIAGSAVNTASAQLGVNVVSMATDSITSGAVAASAVTEIQTGLATAAAVTTLTGYVDTEVASILAAVDTEVGAIKAKTDSLTFTKANELDVNIQSINDVTVNGNGSTTSWGP